MNPTRLFVLGALAKRGPMYGHQLRRNARMGRADLWSDVRPGSLYGALHRLAAEGLIEPVRTEQSGNLPARTVYAITDEGRRELKTLRAEALSEVALRPDPVDLAIAMSGDLDEDTLRGYVEDRIRALSVQAAQFSRQRDRAWPDQTVADDLVAEHARLRLEAELTWHQMLFDQLAKLTADSDDPPPSQTHNNPISDYPTSDIPISDNRTSDNRTSDSRTSDSRMSDSRIWDSRIWDSP